MTPEDSYQRQQATDPKHSYIVQAPAGSGKTEILSQRFLRLLTTVTEPEHIVALTFTRKAAHEMRARVLLALQQAHEHIQATSLHQEQTLSYAHEALLHSKKYAWNLLEQPTRLRILTLDALCQTLTGAMPLQEKQIPYANISEYPEHLYQEAAQNCLSYAMQEVEYQNALKILLSHLDNRQDIVLELLQDLLAVREQWLHILYDARNQDQEIYEQALALIITHEIQRVQKSIPKDLADELVVLTRTLATLENHPESPRYPLKDWQDFEKLDGRLAEALATLLLTSSNTLRKAFDHHVGLKKELFAPKEYAHLKASSKNLLSELQNHPDFVAALIRVQRLPNPHYDKMQWEVLQALFTLLPLLTAHVQVIFQRENTVDFSAVASQAQVALGNEDAPTDLALYLDYHIHHLLIDEFQDTSLQQFHLLSQLVHHWQRGDGKTLFAVGDPMQSIYRFRAAEVGLFLQAQRHGIGSVTLIPLKLTSNFRSTPTLVQWINARFQPIFPNCDDMESGAISYHPSVPMRPVDDTSTVSAIECKSVEEEAQAIVNNIQDKLEKYPHESIAILVRSRRQLTHLIKRLREDRIPFQGVDIDLLAHLPHIRDLWTLTQAFLMPEHRLCWLAFLRSPWCGIALIDLHKIAYYAPKRSIYYALTQWEAIPHLSEEARIRIRYILSVFQEAYNHRYQHTLVPSLIEILTHLHYPKVLSSTEQEDVEQYWQLLEHFEKQGQIPNIEQCKKALNALYSQQSTPSSLQIMTIHKSKGLEFDTVILPSLSTKPTNNAQTLFRWLKLPSEQYGEIILLSPIKAAHHKQCRLYNYLGQLDAQKAAYETQRLLYVAATRARKRLYLYDSVDKPPQGSFRHILQEQIFTPNEIDLPLISTENEAPLRYALANTEYLKPITEQISSNPVAALPVAHSWPRLLGIVAHELLHWMAKHHTTAIEEIPWELAEYSFQSLGGDSEEEIQKALTELKRQLVNFLQDPIGQWLIGTHEEEYNEYAFILNNEHGPEHKIIDRSFHDKGIRWIIDFKTGHEDAYKEEQHRKQVDTYASLFAHLDTQKPIHCGLYYLHSNQWIAWEYQHHEH